MVVPDTAAATADPKAVDLYRELAADTPIRSAEAFVWAEAVLDHMNNEGG